MLHYQGRVAGKNGNTLFKSGVHTTREACAAECFAAKPRARECSTNEVTLETRGDIEYVVDASRNIQWHRRDWAKEWLEANCVVMEPFELTRSTLAAHLDRDCPYIEAFKAGAAMRRAGGVRTVNPWQRLANCWDAGWIFGKRGWR